MSGRTGRPNLGKTDTLKQRSVYIYLPTEEMLEEWKQAARRYDMSLSRFLVEVVDDVLRKNPQGISPRASVCTIPPPTGWRITSRLIACATGSPPSCAVTGCRGR